MNKIQDIKISKFDHKRWVVNTPNGNNVLVNDESKNLLEILAGADDMNDALHQFNDSYRQQMSLTSFEEFVKQKFKNLDILSTDQEKPFKKKSYLNVKIPLLSSRVAGIVATPFAYLFQKQVLWFLFSLAIIFNIVLGLQYFSFDPAEISVKNITIYSFLLYLTMLFHEIGHIAACKRYGIKHGEIGFGFYIIFPVLYANISDIWNAPKRQRLIANIGGIYFELLYASVLGILFLVSHSNIYLYVSLSIFIKTLTELNPFIRYDGYWILSDITNTPNLLPKANATLKNFVKRDSVKLTTMNNAYYYLLLYGSFNLIIICAYLAWVISTYHGRIIQFPLILFNHINHILKLEFDTIHQLMNMDYLLIFGFYLLIIKILLGIVIRKLKINSAVA